MNLQQIQDLDYKLSARLRVAEEPGLIRTISIILAHSGDSWFWLLALLILMLAGKGEWSYIAFLILFAISFAAVLVMILKFTIRRRRPEGEWGQIYRKTDPHSFPSGHATRAILISFLSIFICPPWLALILVIWGPLVALARVAMGVHYLSDILAGGVLGILIGTIILQIQPVVAIILEWVVFSILP